MKPQPPCRATAHSPGRVTGDAYGAQGVVSACERQSLTHNCDFAASLMNQLSSSRLLR